MNAWLQQAAQWSWQNSLAAAAMVVAVLGLRNLWRAKMAPRWLCLAGWLIMLRLILPAPFSHPWAWDRTWNAREASSPPAPAAVPALEIPAPFSPALHTEIATVRAEVDALRSALAPAAPPAPEPAAASVPSLPDNRAAETLSPAPLTIVREASVPQAATSAAFDWRTPAVWTWAAGIVVFLVFTITRHRRFMRRLQRIATDTIPARAITTAQDCAAIAGLQQVPQLLIIPGGGSPFLCGLLRPRIVLPAETLTTLSAAELRHVLLHEMLHISGRDLAANWLLAAIRALHWWNPLVHAAARRLLADRELLRDHQAIALLRDPGERAAYGHTLLKLALPVTAPAPSPGLAPFFRSEKELKRRLTMIQSVPSRHRLAALASIVTLCCISLPVFTTVRGQEDKKSANTASSDAAAKTADPAPKATDKTTASSGDGATQTHHSAEELEQEVAHLSEQIKTLEGLKGEELLDKAMELDLSCAASQKLYPEYKHQRAERQSRLKNGVRPDAPEIKALDDSIAAASKQLEQSAELYRKNLRIRLEDAHKMLLDAKKKAAIDDANKMLLDAKKKAATHGDSKPWIDQLTDKKELLYEDRAELLDQLDQTRKTSAKVPYEATTATLEEAQLQQEGRRNSSAEPTPAALPASGREDLATLEAKLAVLNGLSGEKLIAGVYALDPAGSAIGKLYPEYHMDLVNLESLMKSGFGPGHPKKLALEASLKSKLNAMDAAALRYREGLMLRLKVAATVSARETEAARVNSAALENLRNIAANLRKNNQTPEADAIEKEIHNLSSGSTNTRTAAADLDALRAEMAELKVSVASIRQQAGPDELSRERDRLLASVIGKQDSTDPKFMADKEKLAAIEKLLTERVDRALAEKNTAAAALLERQKIDAAFRDQMKKKDVRDSLDKARADMVATNENIERAMKQGDATEVLREKTKAATTKADIEKMESLRQSLDKMDKALADLNAADPAARIAALQAEIDSLKKQGAAQKAAADKEDLPYGIPVVGKKGSVYSPYAPERGQVDVSDYKRHTKVECPYTRKYFRVP